MKGFTFSPFHLSVAGRELLLFLAIRPYGTGTGEQSATPTLHTAYSPSAAIFHCAAEQKEFFSEFTRSSAQETLQIPPSSHSSEPELLCRSQLTKLRICVAVDTYFTHRCYCLQGQEQMLINGPPVSVLVPFAGTSLSKEVRIQLRSR